MATKTLHGGTDAARFNVDGLKELGANMRKLNLEVRFKIAERCLRAGAAVIQKAAKARAPISDKPHQWGVRRGVKVDPGNLKKNIFILRITKTKLTSELAIRVRRTEKPPKDAFYWLFVEFGTVKMDPRPFMRPAFQESREEAAKRIAARLKQEIEKATRALPKPKPRIKGK